MLLKGEPVHSKIYLWEKNGHPFCSFMGSANYTQTAFSDSRRELLHECNPDEASTYFDSIEPHTMYCDHAEIEQDKICQHPVLEIVITRYISFAAQTLKQ